MEEKKTIPATTQVIETNEITECDLYNVVNHNGEFMIALGNNIVTRKIFASREEAEQYINSKPWDMIINTAAVLFDKMKAETNNQ